MDIQAMQSMDWLFKKERIYLLAQFWQQRATLAEKEVSALKEQLATANQNLQLVEDRKTGNGNTSDMDGQMDVISRSSMEGELAAKEKEICQLVEDVQRLQASVAKLQDASAAQIARLEEQLDHKRQHIQRLEARLDAQRDYDDLKREIAILRSIDFSAMGAPVNNSSDSPNKSLDLMILERTKNMNLQREAESNGRKSVSSCSDLPGATTTTTNTNSTTPSHHLLSDSTTIPPPAPLDHPPPPPPPPSLLFPAPLQNVETFGSFLGEEIVANWRRSLERSILSQNHTSLQPPNLQQQLHSPTDAPATPQNPDDAKEGSMASPRTPPSTTCSPTSFVNTTPTVSSPLTTNADSYNHNLMNGNPKTPEDTNVLCNNNNNHLNNNNMSVTPVPGPLSFFRNDDMKSPFRFDDPRSPFRFAEEGVMVGRLGDSLIPKGDPMEARLQEMLRYNMDKYASQNLDTLHISRRVRELLSINNIGQRLFAKYVLGLSQGTVSELLSKPKPWDKLTEKGRDSYRKMHAWACDENAVLLLKSLIPRKGKDTGIPAFGRADSDNMSEERIAHILNEASHLMKNQADDSRSNDQDSESPNHAQCPSPLGGKDGSQNRRLKKYENDDIPQEKVVRIYQEELAKLMGRRMEDSIRGPREHFPSAGAPHLDRTQDDIRVALDAYHRELAKLNTCPSAASLPAGLPAGLPGLLALQQQALSQHHAQMNGVDLSLPKERRESMGAKLCNGDVEDSRKKESATPSGLESVADVLRHVGSAFSLVRPKIEPGVGIPTSTTGSSGSSPLGNTILPPALEDFTSSGPASASPLQRMASITNSLISQPSSTPHHSTAQRPLKAVLPPITQQQFDNFNNLNTEDIVKKVKESLSQYSISQRLFGESVLGLSQGSVSDLLARPKPWHMLTQKGREPFIRMKMYLEDENAVHKLVASQYKIAPEKLMRTGNYSGNPAGPPWGPIMPGATSGQPDLRPWPVRHSNEQAVCQQLPKQHQPPPQIKMPSSADLPKPENSLLPPSLQLPGPPPHLQQTSPLTSQAPPHLPLTPLSQEQKKASNQLLQTHQQSAALRALQQHVAPSVYEMAALTQDLDTQTITTKIKEALLANNIGQKIFGEAVLGLSQGSVSELLSKPKPWHMLSIKGREPFIRMQLWLSDSHNIDRLQALKNERREANKRRRSHQDNGSDTSSNDTSEFYHSPSPGPPSAKKQRVLFSEEQKEALRLAFALDSYPNVATIEFLGAELALSSRTITNWFHNHRMRLKQQTPHDSNASSRDGGGGGGSQTFDPVQFRLLLNQRLLELQKERMGLGTVPLPYPPYFNNNLAALIASRGMIPDIKEQFSGLDLSMGGLKREPDYLDDDEDDMGSDGEDSNLSAASLGEEKKMPTPTSGGGGGGGRSRRKPAAPQWVNPEWQDKTTEKEVIINGVCVMQTDDYPIEPKGVEEMVRVEPTPVPERYEDESEDSEPGTPGAADRPKSEAGSNGDPEGEGAASKEGEGEETEVQGAVQVRHSSYLKEEEENGEGEVPEGGERGAKEQTDEWQKTDQIRIKVEDQEDRWEY